MLKEKPPNNESMIVFYMENTDFLEYDTLNHCVLLRML